MRWMAPAVLTLLASVSAHAQTKPLPPASWPDKPTATLPRGEYVLTGDTTISYDSITFIDGTIITTSGYEFDLTINDELDIQGKLTIRSYAPTQVPPAPPAITEVAARGTPHFHRGPDAQGDAPEQQDGAAGGRGERGETGTTGATGYDAQWITLRFEPGSKATGDLVILNVGGKGGPGGAGGKGGPGGDGQQGGRCQAYNFESEPGHGGPGGPGGPGGFGGRGGDGGQGGQILIKLGSEDVEDWLKTVEMSVAGGEPGQPGSGGPGGDPGQPGYGGRGAQLCAGKVGEYMGGPGSRGPDETRGMEGATRGAHGIRKTF